MMRVGVDACAPEKMVTVFTEVLGDDRLHAQRHKRGLERGQQFTGANPAHRLMAIFDDVGTPPAHAAARR